MLPTCFGFGRHACSAMCNAARIGGLLFGSPAPEFPAGMLGMLRDAWNAWSPECLASGLPGTRSV